MRKKEYNQSYYERKPWMKYLSRIQNRCKSHPRYNGEKKLRLNFLTKDDIKFLWFRDKAYNLKKSSLDRINNDGDYTVENCQFIEHSLNSGKDNRGEKGSGNKLSIKEVLSIRKLIKTMNRKELANIFNVTPMNISLIVLRRTWKWL